MYIRKEELIKRIVSVTGKAGNEFEEKTVKDLLELYESSISTENRTYIEVTYKDKDIVKLLGARYDGNTKKWYIPQGVELKHFTKWIKNKED